jgi:hypothetical protein
MSRIMFPTRDRRIISGAAVGIGIIMMVGWFISSRNEVTTVRTAVAPPSSGHSSTPVASTQAPEITASAVAATPPVPAGAETPAIEPSPTAEAVPTPEIAAAESAATPEIVPIASSATYRAIPVPRPRPRGAGPTPRNHQP